MDGALSHRNDILFIFGEQAVKYTTTINSLALLIKAAQKVISHVSSFLQNFYNKHKIYFRFVDSLALRYGRGRSPRVLRAGSCSTSHVTQCFTPRN